MLTSVVAPSRRVDPQGLEGLSRGAAWGGVRGSWSHRVPPESFRGSTAKGRSRRQMMTTFQRARTGWKADRATQGGTGGWRAGQ